MENSASSGCSDEDPWAIVDLEDDTEKWEGNKLTVLKCARFIYFGNFYVNTQTLSKF